MPTDTAIYPGPTLSDSIGYGWKCLVSSESSILGPVFWQKQLLHYRNQRLTQSQAQPASIFWTKFLVAIHWGFSQMFQYEILLLPPDELEWIGYVTGSSLFPLFCHAWRSEFLVQWVVSRWSCWNREPVFTCLLWNGPQAKWLKSPPNMPPA